MDAAAREFEMRAGPRDLEKHPVVAGMILKSTDLRKTNAIAVERNELVEPASVPSNAELHRSMCERRHVDR